MPRAARTDKAHAAIRDALRDMGWLVADTSNLGGFVDLVAVSPNCQRYGLIEVKTRLSKRGRVQRTKAQDELLAKGWPITTLCTVSEAIQWATAPKRT